MIMMMMVRIVVRMWMVRVVIRLARYIVLMVRLDRGNGGFGDDNGGIGDDNGDDNEP